MLYDFNSINHPKLMGARRSCGQLSTCSNACRSLMAARSSYKKRMKAEQQKSAPDSNAIRVYDNIQYAYDQC
jgi:hypothetical protein